MAHSKNHLENHLGHCRWELEAGLKRKTDIYSDLALWYSSLFALSSSTWGFYWRDEGPRCSAINDYSDFFVLVSLLALLYSSSRFAISTVPGAEVLYCTVVQYGAFIGARRVPAVFHYGSTGNRFLTALLHHGILQYRYANSYSKHLTSYWYSWLYSNRYAKSLYYTIIAG